MGPTRRIIPDWATFSPQLQQTIEEQENQDAQSFERCSSEDQDAPLYLDASPSTQFHYTCSPNYLQSLTTFSGCSGAVVVGFRWGHKLPRNKMDMWIDDGQGRLRHYLSAPTGKKFHVEHSVFVPTQRVLVGACSDMSLRVFTDITQKMRVLHQAPCPSSVVCMHFCPETNQLLTGSMGLIAFWGFWTSPHTPLGLVKVLDWRCCSLRRDTLVRGLVTERQTSSVYALCGRRIKIFEHAGRRELPQFRGASRASLRCVATDWVQRYLYTGDAAGYVQVWSRDVGGLLHEFRAHAQPVTSVLLRPDTRSLLTASTGGWVKEWSCGGDLLFKLYVDAPGGVRNLLLLGNDFLVCHSPWSMTVWRLCGLYRLFNDTGCGLQTLQRVECGGGRARLLAMTADGVARIMSPATGELLLLSWPFLDLDRALDFAYNPGKEELFVAYGAPDVLVLDTSLSPCPAKHLICTSKDFDDRVMCVEAVQVHGAGWLETVCLVFCGHHSGKLQLLSPFDLQCQVNQAHLGAITQTSSLSGPAPLLCCYGTDNQFSVWSVKVEAGHAKLILNTRLSCRFTPVLSRLLPGWVCAISPRHNLLLLSLAGGVNVERERNPAQPVCCLDYSPPLGLLALSGPGGNVEVWDCTGNLLSEMKLGSAVSQVCFVNGRGDIVAGFKDSIHLISSLNFLPLRLLKVLLEQASADDILEDPTPFLPDAPESYDVSLVPRITPGPKRTMSTGIPLVETVSEAMEEPPVTRKRKLSLVRHVSITPKGGTLKVTDWTAPPSVTKDEWEEMVECDPIWEADIQEDTQLLFQASEKSLGGLVWPVAPDGFLPNSVLRAKGQKEEVSTPVKRRPKGLQRGFVEEECIAPPTVDISQVLCSAKSNRITKPLVIPKKKLDLETPVMVALEPKSEPELGAAPEEQSVDLIKRLKHIIQTLLEKLMEADEEHYMEHSQALLELLRSQPSNPELKHFVKGWLLDQAHSPGPNRKQQLIWRNLESLSLIDDGELGLLGVHLTDVDPQLHGITKNILNKVFSITDKKSLKEEFQKRMSNKMLKQFLDQLDENLELRVDRKSTVPQSTESIRRDITQEPLVIPVQHGENIKLEPKESSVRLPSVEKEAPPVMKEKSRVLDVKTEVQEKKKSSFLPRVSPPPPPSPPRTSDQHGQRTHHKTFKLRARQRSVAEGRKQEKVVIDDPLMFLYRTSQKLTRSSSCLTAAPGSKNEHMQVQPGDSGLGSLLSQLVSSSLQTPLSPPPHPEYCRLQPSVDEGNANWRESLHELVSLYGFRSQHASKVAPPYSTFCPGPLVATAASEAKPPLPILPLLPSRTIGRCAFGQRVLHRTQLRDTWEKTPAQFQHELPLPWQLSSYTLSAQGHCRYGRLELDWSRDPEVEVSAGYTTALAR